MLFIWIFYTKDKHCQPEPEWNGSGSNFALDLSYADLMCGISTVYSAVVQALCYTFVSGYFPSTCRGPWGDLLV